ncbi:unnamed protein product [Cylicostephanus goldi]|uniref:Uncharacterized protein n=1 Tax=Cylicostephanus goldi TaxID=71465 RepID=A0A3P6T082_CYLGO|nr:unnamed protein product [Cylicostephanus goldi]
MDTTTIIDEVVKTANKGLLFHSVSIENYTLEDCQIAYHATTNSLIQVC